MSTHPKYPLFVEQATEIAQYMQGAPTSEGVMAIRKKYDDRRDAEFPDWERKYTQEVVAWSKSNPTDLHA